MKKKGFDQPKRRRKQVKSKARVNGVNKDGSSRRKPLGRSRKPQGRRREPAGAVVRKGGGKRRRGGKGKNGQSQSRPRSSLGQDQTRSKENAARDQAWSERLRLLHLTPLKTSFVPKLAQHRKTLGLESRDTNSLSEEAHLHS